MSTVEHNIEQIINVSLRPSAISAWHAHQIQTDHIHVVSGMVRLVMYDGRQDSPTYRKVNVLPLSVMRPTLVVIPPGIWHGLQNMLSSETSSFINFFDRAYQYEDPDEWRLPFNTSEIPYTFPQI